ncbi:MAG: hypothetical protein ACE5HY_06700, partial [Candidatus Hydrothermarchaeales archaeon]
IGGLNMATGQFFHPPSLIGESVRFGWNTVKRNIGFFIGPMIVWGLISAVLGNATNITNITFIILFYVLYLVIWMGLIRISLRFCDNERAKFSHLFSCFPLFFKYLLGSILFLLIVLAGMILLIVPGIIWGMKYMFFSYFIVDKGLGPIKSLKESSAITDGFKWDLFCFFLFFLGIYFLGYLPLLIGMLTRQGVIVLVGALSGLINLFLTTPTMLVALAFFYRKLLGEAQPAETHSNPREG